MSFRIPVFVLTMLLSFLSLAQASIFSERMKKPDSFFLQKSIVNLITPQILKKELNNFLSLTYPGRSHQNLGHKKINNFFDKFGRENGIIIEAQPFKPNVKWAEKNLRDEFNTKVATNFNKQSSTYKKWQSFVNGILIEYKQLQNKVFYNYFWKKEGISQDKTLIISANIDSIGQGKNKEIIHRGEYFGANDNASSAIVLLELIKVLNKVELPFNVIVVFFDLQEFGNLGSHAFVTENLKNNGVKSYYHLNGLMVSKLLSSKNKREFQLYGKDQSFISSDFLKKVNNLVPEVRIKPIRDQYAGGDAGPFNDFEIPSFTLLGLSEADQDKVIHKVSDTVESIDFYHYHLGAKLLFSLTLSFLFPL